MKAAAFDYIRPRSLDEVLETLSKYGGDARLIAGGQSLVPMMVMRLVRPALLVDIGRLDALQGLKIQPDTIELGAAIPQAVAEQAEPVIRHIPLLAAALPYVGHVQTRNRGTVGGSLAHADPTAEILLTAIALDARVTLLSSEGSRCLAIRNFVAGPMETAVGETECLTTVHFPKSPVIYRIGVAVDEISPRAGDYAIVGVAAEIGLDRTGVCRHARLAASGASPVPVRAVAVEQALHGTTLDPTDIARASLLLDPLLDPESDTQASAGYRRRVAPKLLMRVIDAARASAQEVAG